VRLDGPHGRVLDLPAACLVREVDRGLEPELDGLGVFLLEVFLAISLIFGLFTRLGGILGLLMAFNLLLGLWEVPHEWYWTYIMLMVLQWIFFVTGAGRAFGVNARLIKRLQPRAEQGSRAAHALLALM
jgi:uncharacterized membrane protein YphA (DoxX/SURF4 family)